MGGATSSIGKRYGELFTVDKRIRLVEGGNLNVSLFVRRDGKTCQRNASTAHVNAAEEAWFLCHFRHGCTANYNISKWSQLNSRL